MRGANAGWKWRVRIAALAGALLWPGWVGAYALGDGECDFGGTIYAVDHLAFYAPAKLIRAGDASRVYDTDFLAGYEQSLFPSGAFDEKLEAYRNPPFFALLFVPTANLSYARSAFAWTAAAFACLALSVRLLRPAHYWRALAGFVLFAPTFCAVSYGQTSLYTLLAFAGTYRLLEAGRLTGAGLAASLLLVKPPLLVGLVAWWCLDWRRYWPSLVGVICGGALLSSASMAATPEMWPGFVTSLGGNAQFDSFDWCKAHSLRAFWRLLLTPEAAPLPAVLWLASAALAAGVFRAPRSPPAGRRAGAVRALDAFDAARLAARDGLRVGGRGGHPAVTVARRTPAGAAVASARRTRVGGDVRQHRGVARAGVAVAQARGAGSCAAGSGEHPGRGVHLLARGKPALGASP